MAVLEGLKCGPLRFDVLRTFFSTPQRVKMQYNGEWGSLCPVPSWCLKGESFVFKSIGRKMGSFWVEAIWLKQWNVYKHAQTDRQTDLQTDRQTDKAIETIGCHRTP